MALCSVVVLILDRVTKAWALRELLPGDKRNLVAFLDLRLAFNQGSAFSLADGAGRWLGLLSLAISCGVVWVASRHPDLWTRVAAGLVVGGALGNVWDRLVNADSGFMTGSVTDFLELPRWPIFNIADCGITVGAVLLAIRLGLSPAEQSAVSSGEG